MNGHQGSKNEILNEITYQIHEDGSNEKDQQF